MCGSESVGFGVGGRFQSVNLGVKVKGLGLRFFVWSFVLTVFCSGFRVSDFLEGRRQKRDARVQQARVGAHVLESGLARLPGDLRRWLRVQGWGWRVEG